MMTSQSSLCLFSAFLSKGVAEESSPLEYETEPSSALMGWWHIMLLGKALRSREEPLR